VGNVNFYVTAAVGEGSGRPDANVYSCAKKKGRFL
jgi:hypothetical protein